MDSRKMRLGLYRKIEIARKQLPDMTEEAFRDLLLDEFGVSSRKDMSVRELSRLVDIFARRGVVFVKPRRPGGAPRGLDRDHGFHAFCEGKARDSGHLAQARLHDGQP